MESFLYAFARADLVLAIGTRLDGITTEDYSLLHLVTDQRDIVPGDPEDDVV